MAGVVINQPATQRDSAGAGANDPRWVRWLLTSLAIGFLALFVVLPAANIFAQAFGKGWRNYASTLFPEPLPQLSEKPPTRVQLMRIRDPEERKAATVKWEGIITSRGKQQSDIDSAAKNWSAIRLTLSVAAIVVPANAIFGLAAAWAVTRFRFRGRTLLISLIDLPFSVSPVVAGLIFVLVFGAHGVLQDISEIQAGGILLPIAQTLPMTVLAALALHVLAHLLTRRLAARGVSPAAVFSIRLAAWMIAAVVAGAIVLHRAGGIDRPWDWSFLAPADWKLPDLRTLYWRGFVQDWWPIGAREQWEGIMYTPVAIVIATAFVTFPFVARTLIPVMEANGTEEELAALSLGARPWQMFWRITVPNAKWGLLYGIILCVARACGEFGAVSVVTGNRDSNDTMPLRIEKLWNSYNNAGAFTLASLLTMLAVITLSVKVFIEWRTTRWETPAATSPSPAAMPLAAQRVVPGNGAS
jgi:sulfate/thiosulfate transport system permease protein